MSRISEEQMKYTSELAALELPEKELNAAKETIEELFECFDILHALNTDEVEPAVHLFSGNNVFREDVPTEESNKEGMLANAPSGKDGAFVVLGIRR